MWDKAAMTLHSIEFAAVVAIFLVGGVAKGAIGFGLPTVVMGLMGVWMPPAEAAALMVVPAFLTNIWQAFDGPHLVRVWRRLWPMILTLAAFAVPGTAIITGAGSAVTLCFLGSMLILFGILDLSGARLTVRDRSEPWLGLGVGTSTGLVTGATGVFVVPSALYIQALRLGKEEFTQAMGMMALTASVGLSIGLGMHGHFRVSDIAPPGVAATAAGVAGMAAGRAMRHRMPLETFRRWVLGGLIALGLVMIVRAL